MPRLLVCAIWLAGFAALAAPGGMPALGQNANAPLLPNTFRGWSVTGTPPVSKDAVNSGVLKEDGIGRSQAATYTSGANRLSLQAWQFGDATGAYGAFTFYRQPQMHAEKLGQEGAADGGHFVFWSGTTVVDAVFSRPASDEENVLTTLAGLLPKAAGGAGVPPSLPGYLPKAGLNAASVRYAIGPAAYAQMGGTVPASAIDFSQDAEAVTGQYGAQTLTLILYPTPQIAEAHLKAMQGAAQAGPGIGGLAKRSGPLLAVVSGGDQKLLDAVHFNDLVTINHPEGYVSEGAKMYRLLFGITMLTTMLVLAAVLLGLFLGGGRAMLRVIRGKPISSMSDDEIITLHLGN